MDTPVQNAMQSLQQPPTLNPQAGFLALRQKQAQYNNAAPPQNPQLNQNAAVSQALNKINDTSPAGKVGGALNTQNYSGLCLQYVDDKTGNTDRSPTAFADFQKNAAAGNIKQDGTPPKGARVYFSPTQDNPAGHVGLSLGDGKFSGATTNDGIKTFTIKDWLKYSGQQYLGYAPANSK